MGGKLFFLGVRAKKQKWSPLFRKTICTAKKVDPKVQIVPPAASNNLIFILEIFSFKLYYFHLAPPEGSPTWGGWQGFGGFVFEIFSSKLFSPLGPLEGSPTERGLGGFFFEIFSSKLSASKNFWGCLIPRGFVIPISYLFLF